MNKKVAFDSLVNSFSKLELKNKREEIINDLKETLAVMQEVANKMNSDEELLIHDKMIAINDLENCGEDDFADAVYVYIKSIQESFGVILEQITRL